MNPFKSTLLGAALACTVAAPAFAGVDVGVFVEKPFMELGKEALTLSLSGFNDGPATQVDVHFGLIAPDGTVYEYPDWNTSLRPWLQNFTLPANLRFPATEITDPASVPGGLTPGVWYVASVLTRPGTFDFLAVDLQPFTVVDPSKQTTTGTRYGILSLSIYGGLTKDLAFASGYFWGLDQPGLLRELTENVDSRQQPLESCNYIEESVDLGNIERIDGLLPRMLDAGAGLTLSGAGNSLTLPRETLSAAGFTALGYNAEPPAGFYQSGVEYTFSGSGGADIGAFTAKAVAPSPLVLTQPSAASGVVTHNASQDMTLLWNSNHGKGQVDVAVVSTALGQVTTVYAIYCKFVDDGSGVIPSSMLTKVKAGAANGTDLNGLLSTLLDGGTIGGVSLEDLDLSSFGVDLADLENLDLNNLDLSSFGLSGGLAPVVLTVGRTVMTPFNTQTNDLSAGFFVISTGATLSVSLE